MNNTERTAGSVIGIINLRLLVIGTVVSLGTGAATCFVKGFYEALHITLLAESIVLLLSLLSERLTSGGRRAEQEAYTQDMLAEMREIIAASSDMNKIVSSMERTRDPVVAGLYQELMAKLRSLENGMYTLDTIEDVYDDDTKSIKQLRPGDILRSTCPLDGDDPEAQLSHKGFQESILAHVEAVKADVQVRRLYLVTDRSVVDSEPVMLHLAYLYDAGVDVRVLAVDDKTSLDDILIFGETKVSLGIQDRTGWMIRGAWVMLSRDAVEMHSRTYDKMFHLADRLPDLLPVA